MNTNIRTLALVGLIVSSTAAPSPAAAQQAERVPISIAHFMTQDEIDATGIRTLEPEQLAALNAWLERYRYAVERRVVENAEEDFAPAPQTIETRIDGGFDGWVGDTVFRLKNGQVWRQVSPSAKYYTAEEPRVMIRRSPYLMRVDGIPFEIEVERIK
ncbi:MAG: hypothetical protein AB7N65_03000 [Vicinamibacterales bacterium]